MKYAKLAADKTIGQYEWNHQAHLGSGAFGTVFLGKDTKNNNSLVAIKQLDSNKIKAQNMQTFVQKEIEIMKMLKGENVVGLIDNLESTDKIFLIQLFCNGGDLRHYLEKKGKINEDEAKAIFKQIFAGYSELISKKLVHRDLKPDNVLIHDSKYKLADFGLSTDLQDFNNQLMTIACGTPLYMSPQLFLQQPYTSKSDVFSMGVIYYELLYGRTPWPAKTQQQLLNDVCYKPVRFPSSVQVSEQSKRFIKKCLRKEESGRYTWDQVINHRLFQKESSHLKYSKVIDFSNRIKKFLSKFQDIVCQKKLKIRHLYKQFDVDQKKSLSLPEFINLSIITKIFEEFDINKSGLLSYKEFKKLIEDAELKEPDENLVMVEFRNEKIMRNLYDLVLRHNIDIEEIFKNFDKSGDKQLDQKEFGSILQVIQSDITEKEIYYAFRKFDKDNSGGICLKEFREQIQKGIEAQASKVAVKKSFNDTKISDKAKQTIQKLVNAISINSIDSKTLFNTFDKDQSGALALLEFTTLIQMIDSNITEEQTKEVYKCYDPDQSGSMNYNEFLKMLSE